MDKLRLANTDDTALRTSDLPSLNAIRSFEAAARHQSFTLAARELHVTQGAVSRMVQSLESELGVNLFLRIGRRFELTPAGAAYHPHLADALAHIGDATRFIKRMDGGGMLRISALPTFAMRWLVPRLPSFQVRHSDILVDVSTHERLINFVAEPIDIGIRYGGGQWVNTEATLLMREMVGVFCAPKLAAGIVRRPADLQNLRLLQHTTRADAWQRYFANFGLAPPALDQSPSFEHFFMLIEAAAAGMGFALLPLLFAKQEVNAGRLVPALGETVQNDKAYYLAHAPGAGRSRKVSVFKEWVLEEVKKTL